MKTILLIAGTALTVPVLAGIPLGRGELSANVTAAVTHDSNVFGKPDATADFFGLIAPRVDYIRQAGFIEGHATAGITLLRYFEQAQLNADNLDGEAALQIPEDNFRNFSGLISAAYRENSEIDTDLNVRLNSKTTVYAANGALITGPKSNAAFNGTYTDTSRSGANHQQFLNAAGNYDYNDFFYGNFLRLGGSYDELRSSGQNSVGVPLRRTSYIASAGLGRRFYHDLIRCSIGAGYRVLNRSAAEVRATSDQRRRAGYLFGITVEGPIFPPQAFPRLTSRLALSYQNSATPDIYGTRSTALTGRASLVWQAREHTRVSFTAARNQRLTANDLSVTTTTAGLSLEQTLRLNLTATLGAGYEWSSFRLTDRSDGTTKLNGALRYRFARLWDASLTTDFTATESTLPGLTYDRFVNRLSVTREL